MHNCDDHSCAENVIPQFKYMNFIYSLHIEHFIDMEIYLTIRYEVMFMSDKDFPTCKLSKLGDPTGGRRGVEWLTLIILVGDGVEIDF